MEHIEEQIENDIDAYFQRHNKIVDSNMNNREILVSKIMSLVNEVNISMDERAEAIDAKLNILKQADSILQSKEKMSESHIKLLLQNKNINSDASSVDKVVDILKCIKLNAGGNGIIDKHIDNLINDSFNEMDIKISEDELKPIE